MADSPLTTPVQFLPGVGPRRAELLEKLGLQSAGDILWNVPRDVLDLSQIASLDDLTPDTIHTVKGSVVDLEQRRLSGGRAMAMILFDCGDGYIRGVWFNQDWILKRARPGDAALISGKCKKRMGRWEFSHPRLQWLDDDFEGTRGQVLPKYRLTEGLSMHEMRRISRQTATDLADLVPDPLPPDYRESLKLPRLGAALKGLHAPETLADFEAGRTRLVFDDLLEFQVGVALRRRMWKRRSAAPAIPVSTKVDLRIRKLFPFDLTGGQNRAIHDLVQDLSHPFAMHRLLQADVGAGKTVVAVYAMLAAVAAGHQAVLMAPTELLAKQHWQTIDGLLKLSRVRRAFLSGSLRPLERARVRQEIETGGVQLIVGTHAVISEGVRFKNLGVVVIDEQHRFGVMQRARFAGDGTMPHTLVMTATPIPRSLCLTQFGDLDLTLMTDLPPGRQPVVTSRIAPGPARAKVWHFIRGKLESGRQAYIVCPRISAADSEPTPVSSRAESDTAPSENPAENPADRRAVESVFEELRLGELKGYSLDRLHGGLSPAERDDAMRRFRERQTQVLVATTMVEVGVDVPNATIIVIEQAESFGLSQLHQLRGRVGRGEFQGYCFLMSSSEDEAAQQRLAVLETKSSGFDVAEADFALRGPGDVLGTRQSGLLPLRVADLTRDATVVADTRVAAFELVQSGQIDSPEFAPLKVHVIERFGQLFEISGGG
jgi:ATP-dependent DNA helicase RecG